MATKYTRTSFYFILAFFLLLVSFSPCRAQDKNPPEQNEPEVPKLQVSARIDSPTYHLNSDITLTIEINDLEPAGHYRIKPPSFKLPDGINQISLSSSSTSQGSLLYIFILRARKTAEYKIDPIIIPYSSIESDEEIPLNVEGVSFKVIPYSILGLRSKYWLPVGCAMFIIMGLVAWIVIWRKKRGAVPAKISEGDKRAIALEKLNLCKSYKLEGRYDKFLEAALETYKAIDTEQDNAEVSRLIERIRFGGYSPTSEEMEHVCRDLDNKLKQVFPEYADQIETEGIKLKITK